MDWIYIIYFDSFICIYLLLGEDYDAEDDDIDGSKTDSELMPPPPPPMLGEDAISNGGDRKMLTTPLAAMLPPKYKTVDVRELFPDFRQDAVSLSLFVHLIR